MQTMLKSTARGWLNTAAAVFTALSVLTASASPTTADAAEKKSVRTRMKMRAGTVFNLNAGPTFPWSHQVRGLAEVSNLGNCKVFFDVLIYPGVDGHANYLEGTLTITTLAGDKLETVVVGYGDPDPNDPAGSMFTLHYDVTILGGTGELAGAKGHGDIDGAFVFADATGATADPTDDPFCDAYAGVATWKFDGVLILPRHKK